MNCDDPEVRIAELERQLQEARKQATDQPPAQSSDTGPIPIPGVSRPPADARARRSARLHAYARTMYPILRHRQENEQLVGRVILWLCIAVGLWVLLLVPSLMLFPSTALWTSDVVCTDPYHLEHSRNTVGLSSSVRFRCEDGESSYSATGPVFAFQAIAVALAAAVVTAVSFVIWRGLRRKF